MTQKKYHIIMYDTRNNILANEPLAIDLHETEALEQLKKYKDQHLPAFICEADSKTGRHLKKNFTVL